MSSGTPATERPAGGGGPQRRARWRGAAYGIVILMAGIVMGFAAGAHYGRYSVFRAFRAGSERGTVAKRMARDLELTPEQSQQMERIVSKRLAEIREIRASSRPLVTEQMELMREEVEQILSAEQRQKLSKRFERMERWVKRGRHPGADGTGAKHGPGHGGHNGHETRHRGPRPDGTPTQ